MTIKHEGMMTNEWCVLECEQYKTKLMGYIK